MVARLLKNLLQEEKLFDLTSFNSKNLTVSVFLPTFAVLKLISWNQMEISKEYIYIGLFLTDKSKGKVTELVNSIPQYKELFDKANKVFIDHCTLLHRSQEKEGQSILERLKFLSCNTAFPMVATHIGFLKDRAMAIKLTLDKNIPCANTMPHVTICIFGNGNPFDSNKITEWKKLDKALYLEGYLKTIEKSINFK